MRTREIPRSEWARYLEKVSDMRAERPVRVRIDSVEIGDQAMAECLPLVGISLEQKGSEANAIELTVARPAGEANLTHLIERPEHLYIEEDDAGQLKVLDIEGPAKVKTIVFFEGWNELPDRT